MATTDPAPAQVLAPSDLTAGEDRERRSDNLHLGVITASHVVQHIYPAALAIAYPYVVVTYHISYGELGIMLGVAGLVGGLLQGVAGLVEKASSRLLLSAQNFGLAVFMLLGAVLPGFAAFSAARIGGSVVSWPQHPIGNAILVRRFPLRRAYALSVHTAGGSIGTALAPLITAALIAGYGWRIGIGVLAVPMALGGVLVLWLLQEPGVAPAAGDDALDALDAHPEQAAQAADAVELAHGHAPGASSGDLPLATSSGHPVAQQPAPESIRQPLPQPLRQPLSRSAVRLRDIATRRQVLGALGAGTIAAAGRGLGPLSTYVPAYLKTDLHFSPILVGALFTVLVVGSIFGPVVAGHVADRIGRSAVLVTVYVIGAVAMCAFVLVGADVVAVAAIGLGLGVFAYAESPLLQAVFADGAEGAPARSAFGLYFAISYGVGALWLPLIGWLIDSAGFRVAFYVMGASFVAAAFVVFATRPRRGD